MNEPKSPQSPLDTHRVVRDLVSALESIRVKAAPPKPEAREPHRAALEEFCSDSDAIARHGVTREELGALSSASLLGTLGCEQDVLFMLQQIRDAARPKNLPEPVNLPEIVSPEPFDFSTRTVSRSKTDLSHMAEIIRRESLARLIEADATPVVAGRSPLRQVLVLSSALVLIAFVTWGCIRMVLN